MPLPRGIRNNNPGNIDWSRHTVWRGQIPDAERSDPRFCQFQSMPYGIRALAKTLLTYEWEDGCHTARQIINRWAPSLENDTSAYLVDVDNQIGIKPDDVVTMTPAIASMFVKAISRHENGGDYLTDIDIKAGVDMAFER